MFERVCLVHYHEIGLKGRNRSTFERRLRSNLDAALEGLPVRRTEMLASRLAVTLTDPAAATRVAQLISKIPGVAGVSVADRIPQDAATMAEAAAAALEAAKPFRAFKVQARRSNTDYAERSIDINTRVGAYLQRHVGGEVDLGNPDVTVSIIVTQGEAYVSSRRLPGIGGLPVGSSGRVVSLMSAGIDSPVATWRMIRRGAVVAGVHFSGVPATSDLSVHLVRQIGEVLEPTGGLGRIYIVPFGEIQREIALASPPDLRVLLYRRLMLVIAERIARKEGARALVTGESLGQVASQTLDNIAAVDEAATIPVFRPLIGSDKLEIIGDGRALGTYAISTQPHSDCCTLFMPRNPHTHARLDHVLEAWEQLDVENMCSQAFASIEWMDFRSPVYRAPSAWPAEGSSGAVPGREER